MIGWHAAVGIAWATCSGGFPCQFRRVDADCAPTEAPVAAGEPVWVTASCVASVCCAGSSESCSTTYRPFAPTVSRAAAGEWVQLAVTAEPDGTCGDVPRYRFALPGGTVHLRADGAPPLVVTVTGDLPRADPVPWPPGFPDWSDGLHPHVEAPEGRVPLALDGGLEAALARAGWWVAASHTLAARDGVLVWLGPTLTWRATRVPVGAWWTAPDPCPSGATLAERDVVGATEHQCQRPDGTLHGPFTLEGPGISRRGAYVDGRPDGDRLEVDDGGRWALRAWSLGVPVGAWTSDDGQVRTEGAHVDGVPHGTWVTTRRTPNGFLAVEHVDWCDGRRCGAFVREEGNVVERGTFAGDQRTGRWTVSVDGWVCDESTWVDGHEVGVHRRWQAPDRPFSVEVRDAAGLADGKWLAYDGLGRVVRATRWRHGEVRAERVWVEDGWGGLRRDRSRRRPRRARPRRTQGSR
jgi:hypothetical protein